ncbi:peroxiredoxin family protein [Parendozoicomonas haliclonae]|uniref:thioredoxin-dependent peroxiredoxin n=1 Tax=Parendozoicomonas haliclonae TaxID=1960125 RepID=A0A1X7AR37_9GAMM|nr:peroxiredoxin family protein [Parendozoicomonas haliclonae]SMA50559.1 putative peroxiredoxin bcp [Parendozoicomonas haliclonae]
MNLIKSVFISAYITVLSLLTLWAGYGLWQTASVGYVGLLLAALPGLLFFVQLFLSPKARTSSLLLPVQLPTWAGVIAALIFGDIWVQIGALVAGTGLLAYVFWYSRLGREESEQLLKGKRLPDLAFVDSEGAAVTLQQFAGQPVLMLFYRGNWCPLCMAQIKEIAKGYQALKDRGVQLLMISSQPHAETAKLASRFDAPMTFLVDKGNQAAQILGIAHKDGLPGGLQALGYDSDTTLPTVILADGNGRVIAADQTDNYRVRPEPETFLLWLDEANVV